ncbi:hypothetical protein SARC_01285 [Sphaeroforma arctica JP610]|uniref:GOLD domain-containing protein n=1 Tax=Sphaeroforma arctica JP610 TaxID=667725 RepID=A0A0L0GC48_9EUKA|nr:hypothetical protein SARC_01285 [Sphaeroforma arctica JP610]KNC86562.1 hypothetical protein SARC_01285 [Sphaeroforma arctica JP610]|eukprot:XP_014160464.1 hypothetical protein SARC_01285 [Sphaeroforma arctica JP610]
MNSGEIESILLKSIKGHSGTYTPSSGGTIDLDYSTGPVSPTSGEVLTRKAPERPPFEASVAPSVPVDECVTVTAASGSVTQDNENSRDNCDSTQTTSDSGDNTHMSILESARDKAKRLNSVDIMVDTAVKAAGLIDAKSPVATHLDAPFIDGRPRTPPPSLADDIHTPVTQDQAEAEPEGPKAAATLSRSMDDLSVGNATLADTTVTATAEDETVGAIPQANTRDEKSVEGLAQNIKHEDAEDTHVQKIGSKSMQWDVSPKPTNLRRANTLQATEYIEEFFAAKKEDLEYESQDDLGDASGLNKQDADESGAEGAHKSSERPRSMRSLIALRRTFTLSPEVAEVEACTWGLPMRAVFRICLEFISSGEAKLCYDDRAALYALKRQAIRGPYTPEKMGELGWFDWVGHDIKRHWADLEDMAPDVAMAHFCKTVESSDDAWTEHLLKEKTKLDEELNGEWQRAKDEMLVAKAKHEAEEAEKERQRLAEEKKRELEAKLNNSKDQLVAIPSRELPDEYKTDTLSRSLSLPYNPSDSRTPIDFEEWKTQVTSDPDNVLTVPRGESVVIHVPVAVAGITTWWEYATESYDIAYSVTFEETLEGTEGTQVHHILPAFRHEPIEGRRVTKGSHTAEKPGTYLLKFDNSYSVWRTKTIYYRLYAT